MGKKIIIVFCMQMQTQMMVAVRGEFRILESLHNLVKNRKCYTEQKSKMSDCLIIRGVAYLTPNTRNLLDNKSHSHEKGIAQEFTYN